MKNTELKDGMYVIAPENYSGLTKGKKYQVRNVNVANIEFMYNFKIRNDKGRVLYCLLNNCAHIDFENWIISNE